LNEAKPNFLEMNTIARILAEEAPKPEEARLERLEQEPLYEARKIVEEPRLEAWKKEENDLSF
jgi:hypothetical protein